MSAIKLGSFTAVCERDMGWFPQFARQAEILNIPMSFYGDHLSPESCHIIRSHPMTVMLIEGEGQFSEQSKEKAYLELKRLGFDWGLQMDVDETWQAGARDVLERYLTPEYDAGNVPMVTVVEREGKLYRRTDAYYVYAKGGREGSRERALNLTRQWRWLDPITNGPYLFVGGEQVQPRVVQVPTATVHWGYATPQLRAEHVEKWNGEDGVYARVGRPRPYKKYDTLAAEGEEIPVVPLDPIYFQHLRNGKAD